MVGFFKHTSLNNKEKEFLWLYNTGKLPTVYDKYVFENDDLFRCNYCDKHIERNDKLHTVETCTKTFEIYKQLTDDLRSIVKKGKVEHNRHKLIESIWNLSTQDQTDLLTWYSSERTFISTFITIAFYLAIVTKQTLYESDLTFIKQRVHLTTREQSEADWTWIKIDKNDMVKKQWYEQLLWMNDHHADLDWIKALNIDRIKSKLKHVNIALKVGSAT
jgi:Fe-S cluster assembly scaffold protein SufB